MENNVTELLQRQENARFSGNLTTSIDRLHTSIPITNIVPFIMSMKNCIRCAVMPMTEDDASRKPC